jgi:hypothetical protein
MNQPKPFYIGWMPTAEAFRSFIRPVLLLLAALVIGMALFLISRQQSFSSGVFERTRFTELEGLLVAHPFPALKTFYGKDAEGNPIIKTIPLVNKGKFGADSLVAQMIANHAGEKEIWVTVKGKLIYNKSAVLLELTEQEASMHSGSSPKQKMIAEPVVTSLGSTTLRGQIVDPKCYLGVMKPGEGKPHTDCAIRCISGGIPPVLKIENEKGEVTLFMLRGENGESINRDVLTFIGVPVSVTGEVKRFDDWLIMETDPGRGIQIL